jgi:DNA-binding CsgD family transcriptional regulator
LLFCPFKDVVLIFSDALNTTAFAALPAPLLQGLLQAFDEQAQGLAVVDEQLGLLYANRLARHWFTEHAWLRDDGTLAKPDAADGRAWLKAVRAVCRQHTRGLVSLGGATGPVVVALVPLAVAGHTYALVTMGRSELCGPAAVALFAKQHGLTGPEGQVLAALCRGQRNAAIARQLQVPSAAVTALLGAIRAKVGCTDQRALLQQMACLPTLSPLVMAALTP